MRPCWPTRFASNSSRPGSRPAGGVSRRTSATSWSSWPRLLRGTSTVRCLRSTAAGWPDDCQCGPSSCELRRAHLSPPVHMCQLSLLPPDVSFPPSETGFIMNVLPDLRDNEVLPALSAGRLVPVVVLDDAANADALAGDLVAGD